MLAIWVLVPMCWIPRCSVPVPIISSRVQWLLGNGVTAPLPSPRVLEAALWVPLVLVARSVEFAFTDQASPREGPMKVNRDRTRRNSTGHPTGASAEGGRDWNPATRSWRANAAATGNTTASTSLQRKQALCYFKGLENKKY